MWATYAAAILMLVASAAVGAAILRLTRRDPWLGYGPAVGLALLIAVAAITVQLPGRATTSALVLAVLVLAGAVTAAPALWKRRRPARAAALIAFAATVLATAVPFLVAGNVGVLGVGFNNDMASHLAWTDALTVDPADRGNPIPPGYPVGPHALMASVSRGIDVSVEDASTALTLLISLLAMPAAWSLLAGLPDRRRGVAAVLVALPYLGAAYYGQGAFKESLEALFLLAFIAVLRDVLGARSLDRCAASMITILAAGFLYTYSYVGLVWPVATVIATVLLEVGLQGRRPRPMAASRDALGRVRRAPRAFAGTAAVVLLAVALIAPELARTLDFFRTVGVSPSATGVIGALNLGNLTGQVPPLTALGIWPAEDFRTFFGELDNAYRGGLAGAVAIAAAVAAAAWWRLREELVIPAAALAAAGIYVAVRLRDESAYISAKALAVGAPLAMLFTLRALLARWGTDAGESRLAHAALAIAFVVLAALSSFVALRSARVGPDDHRAELVSFRPLLDGRVVLMLPYDDFARWELPRSELRGPALGVAEVDVRPGKQFSPDKPGDFDLLRPEALDKAQFVVSTTSANRSEPPPNFRRLRRGRFYELWRRTGPTSARRVLPGEGSASGAVMDCGSAAGRRLARSQGWARVAPRPILALPGTSDPFPPARVLPGNGERWSAPAPPGTYEVSLDYDALRAGELRAPGRSAPLAATLDRPGSRWRVATLRHPGGRLRLRTEAAGLPFDAKAQETRIYEMSAVRVDTARALVPLSRACGRYVDWYTLGARRPPVPSRG